MPLQVNVDCTGHSTASFDYASELLRVLHADQNTTCQHKQFCLNKTDTFEHACPLASVSVTISSVTDWILSLSSPPTCWPNLTSASHPHHYPTRNDVPLPCKRLNPPSCTKKKKKQNKRRLHFFCPFDSTNLLCSAYLFLFSLHWFGLFSV